MVADEFVNHVLDILGSIGEVETARFFGGSAIRLAGVQFAMIMQGTLYFVVSDSLREQFQALGSQPFSYYTKHGPRAIHRYYTVPEELLEDPEALCRAGNAAFAHARATSKSAKHKRS